MATPHDKFFKEMFSKKEVAESFIKNYFTQDLLELFNTDDLEITKDSFVDEDLKEFFSDVVYRVKLNDQDAFIYCLFEHKSYPDKKVSFQLLKYMTKIWDLYLKQKNSGKLPVILPLLIYHGGKSYNIDKRFSSRFNIQANTEKFIPDFEYLLFDFSKYSDLKIIGSIQLQIVLKILHTSFIDNDYDKIFSEILELIKKLNDAESILEYFTTGMKYILEIKDYDFDVMHNKVNLIIPERSETFMSTANKLREEGKLVGMKEGRKEELIETIVHLTVKKLDIDSLPKELEKSLYNNEIGTLKIIRDNLLTIESLEDLEEYLN
ncbi:MAG: Rpn family recombination-promoting nuclease/putative transposase [Halanaerobium sp.]